MEWVSGGSSLKLAQASFRLGYLRQLLTPREILPAIRRICHETPVVGFEVVEVAPLLDPGITTVMNARRIILEALTGLAQRELDITEKNYLDPVTAVACKREFVEDTFSGERPDTARRCCACGSQCLVGGAEAIRTACPLWPFPP